MKTTLFSSLLVAAALLSTNPAAAAGKFYKWVDDNGVTHYSEAPPAERGQAEEVRTWSSASSDQDAALERLEQRRSEVQKARERAAQEERAQSQPQQVATERCEEHRKNLETLRNKPVVRAQDPDTGELRTLDAEQREAMIADTEAALEQCRKYAEATSAR